MKTKTCKTEQRLLVLLRRRKTKAHPIETPYHYDNTSMHFNAIFHGSVKSIFETKKCNIILIFVLNIEYGCLSEPPQWYTKWSIRGCSLHGLVNVMSKKFPTDLNEQICSFTFSGPTKGPISSLYRVYLMTICFVWKLVIDVTSCTINYND